MSHHLPVERLVVVHIHVLFKGTVLGPVGALELVPADEVSIPDLGQLILSVVQDDEGLGGR